MSLLSLIKVGHCTNSQVLLYDEPLAIVIIIQPCKLFTCQTSVLSGDGDEYDDPGFLHFCIIFHVWNL